jgi:plasmid stabilization system protein ParE
MVRKKGLKIIWDDEAKKSLRSIYEYIKTRESANAAKRVRNTIVKQTKDLSLFPEKFAIEPTLENLEGNFRFKVIWSYKIIYEVTPDSILVLDIFHSSRDPLNIRKMIEE